MKSSEKSIVVVERAFEWFSRVGLREIPLQQSDVEKYFAPDCRLYIDNVLKCEGSAAMMGRFQEMLEKFKSWNVAVPFEYGLSEGDKAAAAFQYHFIDNAGEEGLIHIIAIWTVRDGRVYETREMSCFEGEVVPFKSYTSAA